MLCCVVFFDECSSEVTLPTNCLSHSLASRRIASQFWPIQKHHNTYVNNINKVIDSPAGDVVKGCDIGTVCKNVKTYSDDIRTKVINSGGGHFNHSST